MLNSVASVSAVPVMPEKLFVHAEIILEGDGGQSLIFAFDSDAFLGFHRLVFCRPSDQRRPRHFASREFVDDDNFAAVLEPLHYSTSSRRL